MGDTVAEYVKAFDERLAADPEAFELEMVELVHALADYGHYAQPYISARNGWEVGADYAEMPGESELGDDAVAEAREACQPYACAYDIPAVSFVQAVFASQRLQGDADAQRMATGLWRYWVAANAYAQAHPED